jgi:hypothetical protein
MAHLVALSCGGARDRAPFAQAVRTKGLTVELGGALVLVAALIAITCIDSTIRSSRCHLHPRDRGGVGGELVTGHPAGWTP